MLELIVISFYIILRQFTKAYKLLRHGHTLQLLFLCLVVKLLTQSLDSNFGNDHQQFSLNNEWGNGFSHLVLREDCTRYSSIYINACKVLFKPATNLNVELWPKKHIEFFIRLLLSGDVSLNPGPTYCGVCNELSEDNGVDATSGYGKLPQPPKPQKHIPK